MLLLPQDRYPKVVYEERAAFVDPYTPQSSILVYSAKITHGLPRADSSIARIDPGPKETSDLFESNQAIHI